MTALGVLPQEREAVPLAVDLMTARNSLMMTCDYLDKDKTSVSLL